MVPVLRHRRRRPSAPAPNCSSHRRQDAGRRHERSVGRLGRQRTRVHARSTPVPDTAACRPSRSLADGRRWIGTSPERCTEPLERRSALRRDGRARVTSIAGRRTAPCTRRRCPTARWLSSQGKADPFATLTRRLARAGRSRRTLAINGLYAATGPEGKVFHVEPSGSTSSVYSTARRICASVGCRAQRRRLRHARKRPRSSSASESRALPARHRHRRPSWRGQIGGARGGRGRDAVAIANE